MSTPQNSAPWLKHIRQDVQSMHAYAIQDSTGMVKLDAMENPFSLPPALQKQLGERLGVLALNRYPGNRINVLRSELAKYAQMPEGFDIMLGNGSDELITLLSVACDVPGASILSPLPGFVMYAMSAQLQGVQFHGVPLSANFELDEAAMLAAIATHKPAVVYLAYPNNPTGTLWDANVIERIVVAQGQQGG
ncbi:MAG: Histidinol-phosphate aminotransferase 2, partial [Pseudomonadota bacterium]